MEINMPLITTPTLRPWNYLPMLASRPVMAWTSAPAKTSDRELTTGKHMVWTRILLSPVETTPSNKLFQHYNWYASEIYLSRKETNKTKLHFRKK
jgi:hypothetical protein